MRPSIGRGPNGAAGKSQQNRRLELKVPVEIRARLKKPEPNLRSGEAVEILPALRRRKKIPGFNPFADVARECDVANFYRFWILCKSWNCEYK